MSDARVGIGLPVFNGEEYVARAIDSVTAQTFRDFRLIISDNASTDRTEAICRDYAARDARIEYHRAPENRGIVWNFNQAFRLSSQEYFMWFSCDDMLAPTYLERCVRVLDASPDVVLCFAGCTDIDETGKLLATRKSRVVMDSPDRVERFRRAINLGHLCEPWCGVTRSAAMRQTPLFGTFADYDRVMIAELGLHGRFIEVPEPLFINREHSNRATYTHPTRFERTIWLDPKKAGRIVFPHFRQIAAFWAAVDRVAMSGRERRACYRALLGWAATYRRRLRVDIEIAARAFLRRLLDSLAGTKRNAIP